MPYGLPPDVGDFTGRSGAVAELTAALTPTGSMPVAAVSGMGGVGKTALAVHVAHAMRRRFPGGRLYVDLRGAGDRPADPRAVLGGLLRALGRPDAPEGLDERAALYRSELAGRRVLVLLDDARDPAQVRPLLPGAPGAAVLVTSRVTMAALPGAHLVDLDVLEPGEAVALLARVAGPGRVGAERGAALDAVGACGFLPLAIRVAGARLAARPGLGVGALARRLARGRLDELPAADACFQLGYDQLGRDEARAFRLLALAGGPGFSTGAAAAALGVRPHRADDLIEFLTDRSLLECLAPGRYRYHDLLWMFALRKAEADSPGERTTALRGLLDFHLASVRNVRRVLGLGDPSTALAAPRSGGERPATTREAGTWLFVEHRAVLTAIERAAEEPCGPLPLAADLLLTIAEFVDYGWNPRDLEHTARAVRDAASRRGMPSAQARSECVLGRVRWWWRRDLAETGRGLRTAVRLGLRYGDRFATALALELLTVVALASGRVAEAAALADRAEEASRALGDPLAEARAYVTRGRVQLRRGSPAAAVVSCTRGLDVYREAGDASGTSYALYNLGVALREAGRSEEALARHAESLAHSRAVGARPREAHNLLRMAEAFLDCGRPRQAAGHAEQALGLFRAGPAHDRGHALAVLGRALDGLGHPDRAAACLAEACDLLAGADGPALWEVRGHLERLRPRD